MIGLFLMIIGGWALALGEDKVTILGGVLLVLGIMTYALEND